MSVRTILVGVDPSEGSREALRWAAELAAPLGARIVLVHVFEPLAHLAELGGGVDLRALRERAELELEGPFCADLRERGIRHETRVVEGVPAEALVRAADQVEADLIVVAARRKSALQGLLLGSTSQKLAHLTRRPVVIVHAGAAGPEPA